MARGAISYPPARIDQQDGALDWPTGIADQQPFWDDLLQDVHRFLRNRPPLVSLASVEGLESILARVAAGEFLVLQAGDCAESMADTDRETVSRKADLVHTLAAIIRRNTGRLVVPVGRIGGQFAKPRSNLTEVVDGRELPVYRGELVNGPQATPSARRPDPARLLDGYLAARRIVEALGHPSGTRPNRGTAKTVWTSHEALVLDYEVPFVRRSQGRTFLGSTHWPWIGERTRRPDGAHVELLSGVVNPVACKVGPSATPAELLELCRRLDPARQPGRLTFIARIGANRVEERLPALVRAVAQAGYPVIWMCDPMHGNTRKRAGDGAKIRLVSEVGLEIARFTKAVTSAGGIPGGLHLETTPEPVVECSDTDESQPLTSTSLCDPRLNHRQACAVVDRWRP